MIKFWGLHRNKLLGFILVISANVSFLEPELHGPPYYVSEKICFDASVGTEGEASCSCRGFYFVTSLLFGFLSRRYWFFLEGGGEGCQMKQTRFWFGSHLKFSNRRSDN